MTTILPQKQISFRSVNVQNGLSQNSVVSIAQDSIGYLWFATQDGLNRYDGKNFNYYSKQFNDITRPKFSHLGKVYVDRLTGIWITTASGNLEKYHVQKDTFQSIDKFKNVSSIHQDISEDYYIGTFGSGLYKILGKDQDTVQLFKEEIGAKEIYGFYSDKNKVFAMSSNGLIEISTNKISFLREDLQFSSAAQTNEGSTWLGTFGKGLYSKNESDTVIKEFKGFNALHDLPENLNVQALLVDRLDRLWVATYGDGAYLIDFDSRTIRHFTAQKTNPFALHYNDVLTLYQDFTGTIWLGTDGAGLSYYDENLAKFSILTNNQTPRDINVDVIRAIAVDGANKIWLGTSGKGLTSYDSSNETYRTFTVANSDISSDRVMSLLSHEDGLWVGLQGSGLNILDANGRFKDFQALSNHTIWKIYKDSRGRLWLCTRDHGLLQFDKSNGIIKSYNKDNSALITNNIRTIEEAEDGTLWVGTETDGLFNLNPRSNDLTKIAEIPDNIKSLYQSNSGVLWIGTNGNGLKSYKPDVGTVQSITSEEGLPNNVIYSILPDARDNLWLSSNRGITKIVLNENEGPEILNYNNYDGLQALEFNTGAYFKDRNGFLYFGGLEGLNWFKPDALTINPSPPRTVITKLELFSEEQDLKPNSEFSHNQNTLTFSFAGLHYSLPERNKYKYRLLPYDEDWIDANNMSTAYYPRLPPDQYLFQVKSSNYDNVWNEVPATYSFMIKRPWYFNTIAKALYILLMILSGITIYRYLKWRWHMKMQLQLEHDETERLKKLDAVKSRLYTNISHEFRTPLTLISGPIDNQLSKADINEEDKRELSLVQRSAKRLLNLVNQMLDLSKLESGSLKLHVTQGNLSALLQQIIAAFRFKAEEKNIDLKSKIIKAENAWFDQDVIEKIVTNLLSNAIKYAPEDGQVAFETSEQDGQLIITVINNGNTISDDELGKLFRRFYQTDKSADGVGIGLSLVKELSILSHGNIVAHTMNEDQIQFTVTIPIERSYYHQSEIVFEDVGLAEGAMKNLDTMVANEPLGSSEELPLLLIIEDDADVRRYIMSIFEKDYTLLEANNGKEGIAMALKHIPDMVISDIMMPIADGIQVCNTLKHDERTSHIPIILLTAKVSEESEIKGLKTGADAYVTKPFNRDTLQIRVQNLIEVRRQLRERYSHEFELSLKNSSVTPTEQKFLNRLQEVLDEFLEDPSFNSETLGEKMLLSRMQLHRKLKALTSMSASEFLRSQRLKLAVQLLKGSDRNISEIAYDVGFSTPSYFIKCFKMVYDCTPSEYLEKTQY